MRKLLLSTAAILLSVAAAKADTVFTLGSSNDTGTSGSGPYASVDVSLLSSTTAQITYTADPGFTFGEVGANVNASSFLASIVNFTQPPACTGCNFKTPSWTLDVGGGLDGFGDFAADEVDNPQGYPGSVISLTVLLTDTSGTWGTSADVLTGNSGGNDAAVHAFTYPAGNSFYASNGTDLPPTDVPEPTSMVLMGVGLIGLGTLKFHYRSL